MRAIDLFRGAGGWSEACDELDIEDYGVENMKEANATAEAAGHKTLALDVWEPDESLVDSIFEGQIASPPCQTFSKAGKGAGARALQNVLDAIKGRRYFDIEDLRKVGQEVGDERTALVLTPLHYAVAYEPTWLAWEQVPTVLPVWEACAEELRAEGYNVWTGNVYSEQHGVPQARKRAALIASKEHEVGPPTPTHSRYYSRSPEKLDEGVLKWVSMAEGIGWGMTERPYPTVASGTEAGGGTDPQALGGSGARRLIREQREAGKWIEKNRPDTASPENDALALAALKAHIEATRDPLPEWAYHRPSTTIVGSFKPEIVAAPGYRTTVSRQNAPDSVRVTAAEAGVLQSFRYDYPWQGARGKQYLQVGNAIPPLMAEAILREATGVCK